MNVTRDVVKDLLTVYLAGEASADTRALVEGWLRTDPDLARQADEARRGDLPPVPMPEPSVEKRALIRTRRWLRARMIVLGVAVYFSTLPFTVVFNRQGFRGLLIQDWPERIALFAVAAVLWVVFFVLSRRLRVSGV
jgi:anti-sigma factor RsiW